ncbi:hypothetical protein KDD17_14010 [Sulfitobacter albidus]|uniref:Uncharacterized protein n=1 Tax=Sulfitobacter albidus TaxID=2829501 RepID=A0A975JCM6_9RHOB|nr:hypothetical protein [Sulfitobacter albidus]QUJ76029.1 hypothetical protein KDD17_14010 [Sulfitobacter albidus]
MATPTVWLPEFQVNTGVADAPVVEDTQTIGLSNGNILIAWTEQGTSGVGTSNSGDIVAKIIDGAGNTVRDSFRVNRSYSSDNESDFDIAATNDGGFVLVYIDRESVSSRLVWERKDAVGDNVVTSVIDAEIDPSEDLSNPQVAVNAADNTSFISFVEIAPGDDAFSADIRGIRLSDTGGFLTGIFDAGDNATGAQTQNDVAINTNGEMVSVYSDAGAITVDVLSNGGILQHRAIAAVAAAPLDPQVATLANGNIATTWTDGVGASSDGTVRLAVYNADLGMVRAATAVDAVDATDSEIVALPDGEFVIVWKDTSANTIKAQKYDSDGTADGSTVTVDNSEGFTPNVGVTGDGRVLFTWEGDGDVKASIWDPRDGAINTATYDDPPVNFVDGDVIYAKTTGGTVNGTMAPPTGSSAAARPIFCRAWATTTRWKATAVMIPFPVAAAMTA